ncbi:MAG: 30S ribosomal protein S14 [Candidatus Thioglobus sp.]|nr:30S ribosomal protein S14 [Candidatus Thioglobus sp.]
MAKKSMINRDLKRSKMVEKYRTKRLELKRIIKSVSVADEERFQASIKLQALPRDASPTRKRSRCGLTGRPHGFYRKFGLSRIKLRERTMNGEVPGLVKASW